MVTNSQIAKAAGVSPAVVSRIVNGDKTLRVSEETRKRVLELVEEMGYAPNAAARSLRSAKAGMIALVVHDVTNPVYAEIISGAQHAAAAHGKAVLLGEASGETDGAKRIEELIAGNGIDGLILQGAGTAMDKALARAAQRSVPTVLLQSGKARNATLLRLDDEAAGRLATQRLIDAGHRRIGFLGASDSLQFARYRRQGWHLALEENHIPFDPEATEHAASTFREGAEAIAALLDRKPDLTAVVAANVITAIGALSMLLDRGFTVPRDFSVIGIQDAEIAAVFRPALTVVQMPLYALGEKAVNVVCQGPTKSTEILLSDSPLSIVERSTIAAPPEKGL
ncbi:MULTISPECIES: LacI family DNA-binding transcriptional regulator [Marinovum]|uniref:LacI family DNA-binding transcriptional regulator n=1 Tax=Marinovum TaxID=367771 RepID=UPI00237B1DA6|nr:LacI family DNA-binding transcriptional regulator [Marinovum sp. PR37]MDD9746856.1 LacI family DNA-binding transcriptional regulator [Marinovum sp. PR37]